MLSRRESSRVTCFLGALRRNWGLFRIDCRMGQEKQKTMGLPLKLVIAGVLICASGIALGWGVLPKLVQNKIAQGKNLAPGSPGRKLWEKLPFPMIFKMHVFNVTNTDAVNRGETPMLDEIGPYYFDEWKEKVDLYDDEKNDTVSFYMKNTWIFNKEKSLPLTGDEVVFVPHPALLGVVLTAAREKPGFLSIVNKALLGIFNNPKDVFLKTKVMDLLFNGNALNCTSKAFAVNAVCMMLKKKGLFPETEPNVLSFSVFGKRNGTKEKEQYRVYRGTKNVQDVGQMVTYNGLPELNSWSGPPCNSISGTDSTIFPPFIYKQDLLTFSSDLCRSMVAEYKGFSHYKAIPTLHYTSTLGDMTNNPDQKCFCRKPNKCMKKGAMDLTNCQGAPLVASLPHFFDADEEYQNGVRGLHPDEAKHGISVDIEAMTGTPMSAKKRMQFSLPLHRVDKINMTSNLSRSLVPFLWVEEGIELSDVIISELESKLFSVLRAVDIGKWVMTGAGAAVSLIGAGLNFINPFSSKTVLQVGT